MSLDQNEIDTVKCYKETLQNLLKDMDIPEGRLEDYRWLHRNLMIRNRNHPLCKDAMLLVTQILKNS